MANLPAFVQAASQDTGSSVITATFARNTTTGNFIIALLGVIDGSTVTVNPFGTGMNFNPVSLVSVNTGSGANQFDLFAWYAENITGSAAPSVTYDVNSNPASCVLHIIEFSLITTSSLLTGPNGANATSSTPASGTAQSQSSNYLSVGFMRINAAVTLASLNGYSTAVNTGDSFISSYKVEDGPSTTAAWSSTGSAAWAALLCTFAGKTVWQRQMGYQQRG